MSRRRVLAVCLGMLLLAGTLSGAGSSAFAADSSSDDGQVIVTPGDSFGRAAPPHVDMHVLERRGEAPTRRAPARAGNVGTDRGHHGDPGSGGGSSMSSDGIPPGCFLGGFGAGSGLGGMRLGGSAFGMRCLPPMPTDPVPTPRATPAPAPLPTAGELAAQAFEQLRLPRPVPRYSPDAHLADGQSATIVGEHTWLWTDRRVWKPGA